MNEDKATRYQRLKRQAGVLSFVWSVALLVGLLWSGWTLTLRAAAEGIAARLAPAWLAPLSVVVYVVLLSLLSEVGGLPFAFYSGWMLERRYGLSTQRFSAWAADQIKAFAVGLALGAGGASIVYWLIRLTPS